MSRIKCRRDVAIVGGGVGLADMLLVKSLRILENRFLVTQKLQCLSCSFVYLALSLCTICFASKGLVMTQGADFGSGAVRSIWSHEAIRING